MDTEGVRWVVVHSAIHPEILYSSSRGDLHISATLEWDGAAHQQDTSALGEGTVDQVQGSARSVYPTLSIFS